MSDFDFRRDNHFVPHAYLKRWAASDKRIWSYRILVSHPDVEPWKRRSIRGVAYHAHLYTRLAAGRETDEIERWLDSEFEAPAEEALRKATSDERLTPDDWERLIRFVASQDVRTPARLLEHLARQSATLQGLLDGTLKHSVEKLQAAHDAGETISVIPSADSEYLPFRVTTEIAPDADFGLLKGEIINGRALWLFNIRHLLTKTLKVLHQHRWTILSPPLGMKWFTSDDPVIRLNFERAGKYDFKGGWGSIGSEILLPLSPHHLLYTHIGKRPPRRGERMSSDQAFWVRRCIAEHAHRMIFAAEPEADVSSLRPRVVSAEILRHENEQWQKWHEEQTAAERELMGWE